jgi:hypothetical protein
VQQLVARAGQVVDVASTEYASMASGEQPRSSERRTGSRRKGAGGSSSNETADKDKAEDEESSLIWKVEVVGLQLALLSAARLGTAQFVSERCTLCNSALAGAVKLEVRSAASGLIDLDDNPAHACAASWSYGKLHTR